MSDAARQARQMWRRFWFDFRIPPARLNLLRVCFFGVLAVDAFLQIAHAPRYGAGDFNVSHLLWLDALVPMPNRAFVLTLFVLQSFLALRAMFGVATTTSVRLLTACFGYTYFVSQLNSYQHHYLIFLLLVITCFVPWEQAQRPDADSPAAGIPSWAMRLFLVQLSLLYLWAAIAKMTPQWLDGSTLHAQIHTGPMADAIQAVFGRASRGDPGGYAAAAKLVMLTELILAAGILWRRAWPLVWVIGVGFHAGVELAGFRIGLFSYFMIAIYVVFMPKIYKLDRLAVNFRRLRDLAWAPIWKHADAIQSSGARWMVAIVSSAAGAVLLIALPFDEMVGVAVLVFVLGMFAAARHLLGKAPRGADIMRMSLVHLLACALLLVLDAKSSQAFDYYKYLGGTSRRLDDPETAKMAYQRLIDVSPDYGPAYYHLGFYTQKDGDVDRAAELYRQAQERDPPDPRPFRAEAQILRGRGDLEGALRVLDTCRERAPGKGECAREAEALRK
ncbi:MAG TPA: HTTM domain-containing protein [Kofleriaceae bacterium]|nr:HTTM domain-containing protein [Kofleriaceae bacterium]